MQDTLVRGKVWPDGSFVLWRDRQREQSEPRAVDPIGLSRVAKSHKSEANVEDSLARGLQGITSYGQNMVRNAGYLLQQRYGGARLSFLTCTLPGRPEDTIAAAEYWPEICRVFLQWLKRRLDSAGLSTAIVSVTEIQPKRFLETGGLPLHLHVVFNGAARDWDWAIVPDEFKRAWKRTIAGRVPSLADGSFASAINVQHVKESAANYLGKYMSKGADDIGDVLDMDPELVYFMPKTWYNLSKRARDAVKSNTVEGEEVGLRLERWSMWEHPTDPPFKFIQRVKIKDEQGALLASFVVGEVHAHWRPPLGIRTAPWQLDDI